MTTYHHSSAICPRRRWSAVLSPPGFQALILEDGSYLATWKPGRAERSPRRDPATSAEVALGGRTPAPASRRSAQLKLQRGHVGGSAGCATSFPEWDAGGGPPPGS